MEYVTVNKRGISVISLSNLYHKRAINQGTKDDYMLHALQSVDHLKFIHSNLIEFNFQDERREIKIMN